MTRWTYTVLCLLSLAAVGYGLSCYVCNTAKVDNLNFDVCDDSFTPSRGATIETGCAACTKEKAIIQRTTFIKRECERALRWQSSVWSCDPEALVFAAPGTKCICTSDYCNSSPKHQAATLGITLSIILSVWLL